MKVPMNISDDSLVSPRLLILPAVLMVFVQSFGGLFAVVVIFGICHDAWYELMWVVLFDLFPIQDVATISGMLFFCRGIGAFIIPILQTVILQATRLHPLVIAQNGTYNVNESLMTNPTMANDNLHWVVTNNPILTDLSITTMANIGETNETPLDPTTSGSRSFGNQMVMALLCAFLMVASVIQLVIYFLIVRHTDDTQIDDLHHKKMLTAYSSMGDFAARFVVGMYFGKPMRMKKGFHLPGTDDIRSDGVHIKPVEDRF